jgi:hypothetical protein
MPAFKGLTNERAFHPRRRGALAILLPKGVRRVRTMQTEICALEERQRHGVRFGPKFDWVRGAAPALVD